MAGYSMKSSTSNLPILKKASQAKAPILEKLESLAMAYLKFAVDFPEEFKLFAIHFKKLDLPEELKKRLYDKFSKRLALVSNVFAEGIQQDAFPGASLNTKRLFSFTWLLKGCSMQPATIIHPSLTLHRIIYWTGSSAI
jgi:hypothetical protein